MDRQIDRDRRKDRQTGDTSKLQQKKNYFATNSLLKHHFTAGITKDKTMDVKLIYIPNNNKQNCPFC